MPWLFGVLLDNNVIVSSITTAGTIAVAYLTTVYAKKKRAPKGDRMEQMFDGYERLIRQKDLEDERKAKIIRALEIQVDQLENELAKTKKLLTATKEELITSQSENGELKVSLKKLRDTYNKTKP